jgi:hypothetical protein
MRFSLLNPLRVSLRVGFVMQMRSYLKDCTLWHSYRNRPSAGPYPGRMVALESKADSFGSSCRQGAIGGGGGIK